MAIETPTPPELLVTGDIPLRSAERDLIRERFRFFATAWCGSSLLWLLVLVFGPNSSLTWWGGLAAATLQAVILFPAGLVAVRTASLAVARAATVTGLALAGLVWVAAIGLSRGPLEILVFVLQALLFGAPLFFPWSWPVELLLIVAIVGPTSLWLRHIGMVSSLLAPVLVAAVGGVIALLITIAVRRDFRARATHREQGTRALQALAESHQAYRALAESARDFIWACDLDGRLTYVNEAVVRFSGLPSAAIIGLPATGFLTDHPANAAVGLAHMLTGASPIVVTEVNTHVGRRWFEAIVSPIHDADGRVTGLRGITRDVTERQEAEERLRVSEARYRNLVETQPDLIVRSDMAGCFTYVNDAYCRTFGRRREELLGAAFEPFVEPEAMAEIAVGMQRLQGGDDSDTRIELNQTTTEGRRRIAWETGPIRDEHGRLIEIQSIGRDVTERYQAELALRKSEKRYRGIVESQHALVLRFDATKRVTFINDVGCATLGLPRGRILGMPFTNWVHPEDQELIDGMFQRLAAPPFKETIVSREQTAEGSRWFEWESSAVLDEQGVPSEFQGVGRDVTERREADEALRQSLVELRRREEQLRLLAQRQVLLREEERRRLGFDLHDDVCQELVGIGILVESVRQRLGPAQPDALELLGRIGRHLGALSEHLRLLARELRPMLLNDLGLEDSLRSLAGGMSSSDTQVVAVFPTTIPRLGEENEVAVYRVAQEALTNAIRHAHATTITVSLSTADAMLRLEIRDDGCGFDPGERRREALGLVSMEERALALGGRVEVISAPSQGTAVRFFCPVIRRAPRSAA